MSDYYRCQGCGREFATGEGALFHLRDYHKVDLARLLEGPDAYQKADMARLLEGPDDGIVDADEDEIEAEILASED